MQCHVAQADGTQWPDRAQSSCEPISFDLGRLRASGQWLQTRHLQHCHPGPVRRRDQRGEASGTLDGTPLSREARSLAPGVHKFSDRPERTVCLWRRHMRAVLAFHPRDLDF